MARNCTTPRRINKPPDSSCRTRTILLVDMDSFFSSIEMVEHPELVGLPVVVGADPKEGTGRGVVSTCSYEAREYGIHSGMPISKAYRLCPDARFLPVDMALYQTVSRRIMKILQSYAHEDKFQKVSIDEAFIEIKTDNFEDASRIALNIKKEILEKEKLISSIGIGPNKLVAKIASEMQKPDGLTIVAPGKVQEFLDPMPVKKIPGIGKKTEKTLKGMGIETIRELRTYDVRKLVSGFGKWGYQMQDLACGIDESEVKEDLTVKSVGRELTFDEDTSDPGVILDSIDEIACETYEALLDAGYLFRTVSVKVRFEDFDTHTRARSIGFLSCDPELVRNISKELVSEFIGKKKIRLIGVRLSNLQKANTRQTSIYEFIQVQGSVNRKQ
ncbi:MAG TPA: DNA polymerase IV [Methanosarcinales archaeon]|nr:DNA polymerase IV [Methanosarcinales archaeon]